MATATTLPRAAGLAWDNLQVWWLINQMKPRIQVFCSTSRPLFLESEPNAHPVSNWLVLLSGVGVTLPSSGVTISQLGISADYVYRLCWMAETLRVQGLISSATAATLLGNYNGNFA